MKMDAGRYAGITGIPLFVWPRDGRDVPHGHAKPANSHRANEHDVATSCKESRKHDDAYHRGPIPPIPNAAQRNPARRDRHQQPQTSSRASPPQKATGMDWKCSKTAGNADLQVGTTAARWPQPTCLALSAAWRLLRTHSNNNLTKTDDAVANLSCQLPAQLDRRVSTVHRERCCQLCVLQRQFLLAQPFAASQS